MAAAIRHAARRRVGGGALQQAVVQPARLVSTKGLTADEKKDAAIRLVLIDKKTEELYDMMAGFNAKYTVSGSAGQKYTRLLNELSVQIQPRRDDPRWWEGFLLAMWLEMPRFTGTKREINKMAKM